MSKRIIRVAIVCLAVLILLILTVSLSSAQQGITGRLPQAGTTGQVDSHSSLIPVQGRLTDASGNPLNGTFLVDFRIYGVSTGGIALCDDLDVSVEVENGLFTSYMNMQGCDAFDGKQLYLGITVGDDPEMTPRQSIDNVPYAYGLRPGAVISDTINNDALLHIENWAATGRGLRSYAMSQTGINYGIVGASRSPDGFGGYFYNSTGVGLWTDSDEGTALYATSANGVAIAANGVITSSEPTYLWVSGNDVRAFFSTDSTVIDLNSHGGAQIQRGGIAGFKSVVLPITIAGTLYGQNVRLTDLDLYWQGDTEFEAVTTVRLRLQTGLCSACYVEILADTADHTCWEDDFPEGCILHYDLSANNILTPDSGILYLTVELGFSGPTTWIDFGGARLTLDYDD